MKVLLITGVSGCGKTTIGSKLNDNDFHFNFIRSFTDRPRRINENQIDHHFISKKIMDFMLTYEVVASTTINGYRYCTTYSQFDDNKINIYIVDQKGMNDTKQFFKDAQFFSVLVQKDNINIDQSRKDRNIVIPCSDDVDFVLENNDEINIVVERLRQEVFSAFGVD